MSKFENVPVEDDTTLIGEREVKIGEFDVLYQMWTWQGVSAESIIFVTDEIADKSDEELEALVRTSPFVQETSKMTIERSDSGYTFTNFNFEAA